MRVVRASGVVLRASLEEQPSIRRGLGSCQIPYVRRRGTYTVYLRVKMAEQGTAHRAVSILEAGVSIRLIFWVR